MTRKQFINKCQYYKIQRNESNIIADLVKERKVRSYDELYKIYKPQFELRGIGRLFEKVGKGITKIIKEVSVILDKYLKPLLKTYEEDPENIWIEDEEKPDLQNVEDTEDWVEDFKYYRGSEDWEE